MEEIRLSGRVTWDRGFHLSPLGFRWCFCLWFLCFTVTLSRLLTHVSVCKEVIYFLFPPNGAWSSLGLALCRSAACVVAQRKCCWQCWTVAFGLFSKSVSALGRSLPFSETVFPFDSVSVWCLCNRSETQVKALMSCFVSLCGCLLSPCESAFGKNCIWE